MAKYYKWKTIILVDEEGKDVVINREKDNVRMWGWEWSNEDAMTSDNGITLSFTNDKGKQETIEID